MKSVEKFEVRLWSKVYYGQPLSPKHSVNIFDGTLIHKPSNEQVHFHSVADFLTKMEQLYFKYEKEKKQ